jgi:hypothetical protein
MNDFSLYPIQGVAREWRQEQFDLARLPIEIVPGVRIEDVSSCIASDTFKVADTPRLNSLDFDPQSGRQYLYTH